MLILDNLIKNEEAMNDDLSFQLERCIVDTAEKLAIEHGMNYSDLAKKAFGERKDYVRKWRKIRGSKTTKPQRLTVSDAALLARAFGKDLPELVFLANEKLKAGWTYVPD